MEPFSMDFLRDLGLSVLYYGFFLGTGKGLRRVEVEAYSIVVVYVIVCVLVL